MLLEESPIRLTQAAVAQIRTLTAQMQLPDFYGLRLGLKGAACGAAYLLGFDTATPDDHRYLCEGVQVLVSRRHLMYLFGAVVDYDAEGEGFFITKDGHVLSLA